MPTIDSKTVAGTATSPPLTSPPGATTAPPKSAIGIFTATTVAPRAILTTVLRTLKVIAKPVTAAVRATRRRDPTQSRGAALMHEARLAIPEELDEWQEVDGEDVKEDMRVDWLRLRWEKERAEKLAAGIAVDENDGKRRSIRDGLGWGIIADGE
jgi:hypothetical protein